MSQEKKLTATALANIPNEPSSLEVYINSCESHEHRAMGLETNQGKDSMSSELDVLDAKCKASGEK